MFLSRQSSWFENLRFASAALRVVYRAGGPARSPDTVPADSSGEEDKASPDPLVIRYDHVVVPPEIDRWIHNSRHLACRHQGAEAYAQLAKKDEHPGFLDSLRWGAMSLFAEELDDDLNRVAIQSQRELSAWCSNPIQRAYADFAGAMWAGASADPMGQRSWEAVRAHGPDWMWDDWLLLDMVHSAGEHERLGVLNRLLNSKGLVEVGLSPAIGQAKAPFDRLDSHTPSEAPEQDGSDALVSVIVPAYNAESTLRTSIVSLMKQSWSSLEIIAIDDASTDQTRSVLEELAAGDSRMRVLGSKSNAGAYAARNLGLAEARGRFVTVADSDDWHHPQKIERQCRHLLDNPHIVANMPAGFRVTDELRPISRRRPFFKHGNLTSLLFRREPVINALGGWNTVRFAADTEFYNRLELVFGKGAIFAMDLPLILARMREGSLTNNPDHGYFGHDVGARKEYVECYRYFQRHAQPEQLRYPLAPDSPLPFPVPEAARSRRAHVQPCEVVYAGDLRDPEQAMRAIRYHREGLLLGLVVGLLHIHTFDPDAGDCVAPFLRDYLFKQDITLLTRGETVTVNLLVMSPVVSVDAVLAQLPNLSFAHISTDEGGLPELGTTATPDEAPPGFAEQHLEHHST